MAKVSLCYQSWEDHVAQLPVGSDPSRGGVVTCQEVFELRSA